MGLCVGLSPSAGFAQVVHEGAQDPLALINSDNVRLKASISSFAGTIGYSGTWFGLAEPVLGTRFDMNRRWAEGWVQPGLELSIKPASTLEVYGGLSLGLSGTLGRDPYDYRNRGAAWPETAFVGVRTTRGDSELNFDLSIGQQPYTVGTGMLLTQGAGNGLERGALLIAPRVSWGNAAIARMSLRGWNAEAFYLDPNEVPSENTGTKLAGALIERKWAEQSRIGAAFISVIASSAPYPIARLPFVIDDARRNLQTWHAWSRVDAAAIGLPNTWVRLEGAIQSNARLPLKSRAAYAELGPLLSGLELRSVVILRIRIFFRRQSKDAGDRTVRSAILRWRL